MRRGECGLVVLLACGACAMSVSTSPQPMEPTVVMLDMDESGEKVVLPHPSPKDDRHFGGLVEDSEHDKAASRTRAGNFIPVAHDKEMSTQDKRQTVGQADNSQQVHNAVAAYIDAANTVGNKKMADVSADDRETLTKSEAELKKANKHLSNSEHEKDFQQKLSKFKDDGPGEWAKLYADQQAEVKADDAHQAEMAAIEAKLKPPEAPKAEEKDTTDDPVETEKNYKRKKKEEKDAEDDKLIKDRQFKYDNHETDFNPQNSPSFQSMERSAKGDVQQEQKLAAKEKQYKALKKTGKMEPLELNVKTLKKQPAWKVAEIFVKAVRQHEAADQQFHTDFRKYEGKYREGMRTDFKDEKHSKVVTSPEAQKLYEKLLAQSKSGTVEAKAGPPVTITLGVDDDSSLPHSPNSILLDPNVKANFNGNDDEMYDLRYASGAPDMDEEMDPAKMVGVPGMELKDDEEKKYEKMEKDTLAQIPV